MGGPSASNDLTGFSSSTQRFFSGLKARTPDTFSSSTCQRQNTLSDRGWSSKVDIAGSNPGATKSLPNIVELMRVKFEESQNSHFGMVWSTQLNPICLELFQCPRHSSISQKESLTEESRLIERLEILLRGLYRSRISDECER
ncbi:hypothetical protein TNCV_1103141 [Trichonephila clavipes]|nr:hypothetical protein TNCV_1103141 [Trichonephila clavipes]